MINFPGCKINLGLSISEKRNDGFHTIETVLYPIPLFDALEIIPSKKTFEFKTSGNKIPGPPDQNLVIKAYKLLDQRFGLGPVKIHLHKKIPTGAGLGGGSSDAAQAIVLLNDLFDLRLSIVQMETFAGELGSDCPFFIQNHPTLAFGKGDQLKKAQVDIFNYRILIVKPDLHINTAEAYSWVKPAIRNEPLQNLIRNDVSKWTGLLINDFEEEVFVRHPLIGQIKTTLYQKGAVYASMTGTGSAIYGLFEKSVELPHQNNFPGCYVWASKPKQSEYSLKNCNFTL